MLRAVIVSPDRELAERLAEIVVSGQQVTLVKVTERYLASFELERFLRANAPQLIFLSIAELPQAVEMFQTIGRLTPGVQIVAVDRSCDPQVLLDLMHAGVREFLAYPFEPGNVQAAIRRVAEELARNPARIEAGDNVFAFLPSKAGAGTSTIALNAAVALSRLPDTHTLLMDLDLNSGLLGFSLKLDNVYTIYEAAENASKLDEHLWPQLIASVGKLDVLPSGRLDPHTRIDPMQIRELITFARRFYKAICVDLSGNMEKFSLEVMQEAKKIFLVVTPEIPSLHLARQKFHLLNKMEVGSRVAVLLNRAQKKPIITPSQIEELLGVPVYQEFPNDYKSVHDSVTNGREVVASAELGRQFTALAMRMMEKRAAAPPRKKFLEYFNMAPSRVTVANTK